MQGAPRWLAAPRYNTAAHAAAHQRVTRTPASDNPGGWQPSLRTPPQQTASVRELPAAASPRLTVAAVPTTTGCVTPTTRRFLACLTTWASSTVGGNAKRGHP